jgi:hypothetical protein
VCSRIVQPGNVTNVCRRDSHVLQELVRTKVLEVKVDLEGLVKEHVPPQLMLNVRAATATLPIRQVI